MKVWFLLLLSVLYVQSARILGIFPAPGKSMNILYNKLMKGLADSGHDVTVISAHPNKLPTLNGSYTDIVLTGFVQKFEDDLDMMPLLEITEDFPVSQYALDYNFFVSYYNETFRHPNVVKFLNQDNQTFDLVISEYLYSEIPFILASTYHCPLVVFSSCGGVNPWVNAMVGNNLPASYIPHYYKVGDYSQGLSLLHRAHNLLFYLFEWYHRHLVQFPESNQILQSLPFPNKITASQLYYNSASLVLLGTHSSFRQAAPLTPNIVEIGGFHIDPPKKLPQDLQQLLDNSKEGIIYFSMGSHLKSKSFRPERKQLFLEVFRKLPVKILWKYEEDLAGKPDNVFIKKWVPQMDVLAHPNVKLFITHAGHGSIMETIHRGVPALMIPVFTDQFNNAFLAESKGFALRLPYSDKNFTATNLLWMIEELLHNPLYKQKAKQIQELFFDRPVKPLDNAVYWMEYVIRHKGADHLKVAANSLTWYQFYMVDVASVACFVLVSVGLVLRLLFMNLWKFTKKVKQE